MPQLTTVQRQQGAVSGPVCAVCISPYVHSALKRCTTREKKTERQIDRHGFVFNSVTVRSVHPAFPVSLQFDAER